MTTSLSTLSQSRPLPAGRMPAHRLRTVTDIAREAGAGAAVLTQVPSVRWLGIQSPAGKIVVVSDGDGIACEPQELDAVLSQIGFERDVALAADTPSLGQSFTVVDAAPALAAARMRKERYEIDLIAEAARLAAVGHVAGRAALTEGVSESVITHAARDAIGPAADGLVVTELAVAARATSTCGPPPAPILQGAPIVLDVGVRSNGYWAEAVATFTYGVPSAALRRAHEVARTALEAGLAAIRPGVAAGDVDAAMRAELTRAGVEAARDTGHGVGTAAAESPWLAPDRAEALDEDMVIVLRPAARVEGLEVRLGVTVVVEADGARALTEHLLNLAG